MNNNLKICVVIYESSSFGGCYNYSLELFKAYGEHNQVSEVNLLLPSNSELNSPNINKNLLNDRKTGKLAFLTRQIRNPFILFSYLRKMSPSFVILNDFEQISAPLWAPIYRLFLRKHQFAVFLHDADRDAYPPSKSVSAFCMNQIMRTVSLALFHGELPARKYYKARKGLKFLQVQHGPYSLPAPDGSLLKMLKERTSGFSKVLSVPGNIRIEKNYNLVIKVLKSFPEYCLIIAGNPANSQVETTYYKNLIRELDIENQIIWVEKFLTDEELSAVISVSELVVLYYAASFHSQSGILHQVIPLKKTVLVSDLPNALTETVKHYNLGYICKADDEAALKNAFSFLSKNSISPNWEKCLNEMSWGKQVEKVLDVWNNRRDMKSKQL